MADRDAWSSDCLISVPQPLDPGRPAVVGFGGFGWTTGGIAHDLSRGDVEEMLVPTWAPQDQRPQTEQG